MSAPEHLRVGSVPDDRTPRGNQQGKHYFKRQRRQQEGRPLEANVSIDFGPTLAAQDYQDEDIEVLGAEAGDAVLVTPDADPGLGCIWSAWISTADTVTVRIANPTGSSATLTPQVWRVAVIKHP
jgi:hypothetical protein